MRKRPKTARQLYGAGGDERQEGGNKNEREGLQHLLWWLVWICAGEGPRRRFMGVVTNIPARRLKVDGEGLCSS